MAAKVAIYLSAVASVWLAAEPVATGTSATQCPITVEMTNNSNERGMALTIIPLRIDNAIYLDVSITNHCGYVLLAENMYRGSALANHERFELATNGRSIPYIGPVIRRQAFSSNDFHPLAPGQTEQFKIRIDQTYQLEAGVMAYQVRFNFRIWNQSIANSEKLVLGPIDILI